MSSTNTPEIFLEVPLNEWLVPIEDFCGALSVRLQRTEITEGGMGFVFDLMEEGKLALSAGLLVQEATFISLYLFLLVGRKPAFPTGPGLKVTGKTQIRTRLYTNEGGTNASGCFWLEDGAIWIGFAYAGELICRGRLDDQQVAALGRLADAMDEVF